MNSPTIIPVTLSSGAVALAVGAGAHIHTQSIDMSNVDTFALRYSVANTGVPSIKIEMEQSDVLPTTEGADDLGYVVPETVADVVSALADNLVHRTALFPICCRYLRFKITELTTTVADSVLTMNLSVQNRFRQ
jgi:hypothetical protein